MRLWRLKKTLFAEWGITALILAAAAWVWVQPSLLAGSLVLVSLLIPARALIRQAAVYYYGSERVLIIGTSPLAQALVDIYAAHASARVVGVLDDTLALGTVFRHSRVLGRCRNLNRIVDAVRPTRIILAPTERRGHLPIRELLRHRMLGIRVEDGLDAIERLSGKLAIEHLHPSSLLFCAGFRQSRWVEFAARFLSVAAGLVGAVVFAPLIACIAVAIRVQSPGGVFFVQRRVGLGGRPFNLVKFRTMVASTDENSLWVHDNQQRITRVGRLLRAFRLDELPQFWNLLRGDMNLVGPRPHPMANYTLFAQRIPYYWLRTLVRPGLTGWAQVRYGYANSLEEETEKMRFDLYYIKRRSIWLDLKIIPLTVRAILQGGGSARRVIEPSSMPVPGAMDSMPSTTVGEQWVSEGKNSHSAAELRE